MWQYADTYGLGPWIPFGKAGEIASSAEVAALVKADLLHGEHACCPCLLGDPHDPGGWSLCALGLV